MDFEFVDSGSISRHDQRDVTLAKQGGKSFRFLIRLISSLQVTAFFTEGTLQAD